MEELRCQTNYTESTGFLKKSAFQACELMVFELLGKVSKEEGFWPHLLRESSNPVPLLFPPIDIPLVYAQLKLHE